MIDVMHLLSIFDEVRVEKNGRATLNERKSVFSYIMEHIRGTMQWTGILSGSDIAADQL